MARFTGQAGWVTSYNRVGRVDQLAPFAHFSNFYFFINDECAKTVKEVVCIEIRLWVTFNPLRLIEFDPFPFYLFYFNFASLR